MVLLAAGLQVSEVIADLYLSVRIQLQLSEYFQAVAGGVPVTRPCAVRNL